MKFRYRPPFVSLRWQVTIVLIATSAVAVAALLSWAAAESEDDLKRRILSEQQHLIADLRNTSKQGFNLLADRARQLESVLPLANDDKTLQQLAQGFSATLIDSSGNLIAGRPAPDDANAKQWIAALFKNGGEYRRWFCQQHCELQYFSVPPRKPAQLTIQHIAIDDLMAKLDISHAANLWLVQPESPSEPPFYQTTSLTAKLRQSIPRLPLPPHYVIVDQQQAMWRWPLQNDGIAAELWVAMATQHSLNDVQQVWQKTTIYIVVTLALCCAIAIGLIWRPLLRLRQLSRHLPTLANDKYHYRKPSDGLIIQDESHQFANASYELAEKLNEQRRRLLQQTHELQRLAQHDQLTGLNNRSMFEQSLQQTISQLGRHIQSLAVMFMDLNKFKLVNDSLGHEKGDQLLQQVAIRLASLIRKTDVLARFGGDEFVLLLTEPGDHHQLKVLAEKLITIVNEPIQLGKDVTQVGLSVGITVCSDAQCTIDQLLREADAAMYSAKRAGASRACFYHTALQSQQNSEQQLEDSLHRALTHQALSLQFKPILALAERQPVHFQASLNWPGAPAQQDGEHSAALPGSAQVQQQLHEWMLQQVLDIIDQQQLNDQPSSRIFIQGADFALQQPELLRQLVMCCRRDANIAKHLGLFIDEQSYIDNQQQLQIELNLLHELGMSLALDRFGNGLGALSQISQSPPLLVRLDEKFCHGESLHNGVTESLIRMLHKMDIQVLACGITQHETLQRLQQLNCDLVQGSYFGPPIAEHELNQHLTRAINS